MNRHVIMWSAIGIALLALAVGATWFTLESGVWWEPVFHLIALVAAGLITLYSLVRAIVLRNDDRAARLVGAMIVAVGFSLYGAKLFYETSYHDPDNLLTGAFLVGISTGAVLALKGLHGYLKKNERSSNGKHLHEAA